MSDRASLPSEPVRLDRLVGSAVETVPDKLALVSRSARWTFVQLAQVVEGVAVRYRSLGLEPGERVASLMPNTPELMIHYLACFRAGLVATPLNYRYATPEIDHALATSGAALLLCHHERRGDLETSRELPKLPAGVVWFATGEAGARPLADFLTEPVHETDLTDPDLSSPALIFFTSGSTGLPKGVTHTYETFGWLVAASQFGLEFSARDVLLPGSSLSHVAAVSLSLAGLAAGATVLVARRFDADELLPLLREHRPTFLCMLPAALFALVRDHDTHRGDFASLRLCISGGDKISSELEKEFEEASGRSIDEVYGMTETGTASLSPPAGAPKLGSIGRPIPPYTFQLRRADGTTALDGEEGQLWIRSPTNMVGYWNAPAATAAVLRDGWLDTGDVMCRDAEGYYWFRGRKKQLIIHDGSNIAPQETEEALLAHPAVALAGVVGVHDPLHGENVRAYLTLVPGAPRPSTQELVRFVRARIAAYKAPEEIVWLDEMPLNATGKIDRVKLKQLAGQQS